MTSPSFVHGDVPNRNVDPSVESPLRVQRLKEKRELQDLNHRLEYFMNHVKQKDLEIEDLKKQLDQAKQNHQEQLQRLENEYDDRAKEWQNDVAKLKTEMIQKDREYEGMKNEFESLQNAVGREKKRVKELENELNKLNKELGESHQREAAAKTEADTIRAEQGNWEQQIGIRDDRVNRLEQENDEVNRELHGARANLQSLKDKLESQLKDAKTQIHNLQQGLDNSQILPREVEEKLRIEFNDKFKKYMEDREQQYQTEKEEWIKIFREEWNRKFSEKEEELKQLQMDRDNLIRDLRDLQERTKSNEQLRNAAEARARGLEEENSQLRKELEALRKKKEAEIKELRKELQDLKDAFRRKEIQFEELFGIKVSLDDEINHFKQLVDKAETDEGYESPIPSSRKRRRRTHEPGNALQSKNNVIDNINLDNVLDLSNVSGANLPLDVVSINSQGFFEISNLVDESINLNGLRLSNIDKTSIFDLPRILLPPNERIRIWIGKNPVLLGNDLYWSGNVWDGESENAIKLLDMKGNELRLFTVYPDIIPESVKENCLIM